MKSLHFFHYIALVVSVGVVYTKTMEVTGQKAVGFEAAKRTGGFETSTIGEKLKGPGIVAVLEQNCNQSRQLEDTLKSLGVPYQPFYVEENLDLYSTAISKNGGEIPLLYEDGKKVENVVDFLKKYKEEHTKTENKDANEK
ncbi:uncharacterized protein Eint_081370 [Encephalitozoon intestinalis ATCC 50506]|uniref:Glutaredoxin domain-containing protein n=1 Tax=Encephalitozoon intestinalis (strain ATCC 50506) TaxID=876142 RepID=E0S8D1_ENCIT|nr:uncharacterized protein Eint_081370 [Encephalitozoon intestinalis ATCC 50506]ADM12069.2 hypothetical protein Eint_081370 [Encephalitozoon intestinalis ATCC 50506]UTX45859.1 glutaredoxin-2 [Encephalitozoon intestinalis]